MKINLCCGKDYREDYINVDFSDVASDGTFIKVDFKKDIRYGLPWKNNSIEEIIFHESLEHFNRWDGLEVLKEIYRVLEKNGTLHLTVPPAEKQMKILLTQFAKNITMDDFFNAHEKFSPIKFVDDLVGATHLTLQNGKDLGQGDSHKMFYSKQWLQTILKYIGFNIDFINNDIKVIAKK